MISKLPISDFTKKVIEVTRKIPSGKVATYKQVAELAGKEHASRGVAWVLNTCSTKYKLPWHRVINSQGKISFDPGTYNFREQKKRLQREGIAIDQTGALNLKVAQWKKRPPKKEPTHGQPKMFSV